MNQRLKSEGRCRMVPRLPMSRTINGDVIAIGLALTLSALLSGCVTADQVWLPSYPGARETRFHEASARGGAKTITVQFNEDVSLLLTPISIDRKDSLRLSVVVAPGGTLWLVSDQARIETAQDAVPALLQYQGAMEDIAADHQQGVYQLVGRTRGYSFVVPITEIKGDVFYLMLPILTDLDNDIDMVRVRFDRRRITAQEVNTNDGGNQNS
jgi:hypothetical protein